jgi:hypothetical protein
MRLSTILAAAVLGIAPVLASATPVYTYTQNFEAFPGPGLPVGGVGAGAVESIQGYPAVTFGSQFLRNTTASPATANTLILGGLPAHTTVDLDFDLATINSWDGGTNVSTSPNGDFFNVKVDGTLLFTKSFSNGLGEPGTFGGAPFAQGNFGFDVNTVYQDGAYHLSFQGIPHTGSSLTVEFFASGPGWQGGDDESWAVDNVAVAANVPEPASFAGAALATALMAAGRRRRA